VFPLEVILKICCLGFFSYYYVLYAKNINGYYFVQVMNTSFITSSQHLIELSSGKKGVYWCTTFF